MMQQQAAGAREHPPRLEYIARGDADPRATCDWEFRFVDYDGTGASAACRERATVYAVEWDGDEWIAHAMCRPHGNMALADIREAWHMYGDTPSWGECTCGGLGFGQHHTSCAIAGGK